MVSPGVPRLTTGRLWPSLYRRLPASGPPMTAVSSPCSSLRMTNPIEGKDPVVKVTVTVTVSPSVTVEGDTLSVAVPTVWACAVPWLAARPPNPAAHSTARVARARTRWPRGAPEEAARRVLCPVARTGPSGRRAVEPRSRGLAIPRRLRAKRPETADFGMLRRAISAPAPNPFRTATLITRSIRGLDRPTRGEDSTAAPGFPRSACAPRDAWRQLGSQPATRRTGRYPERTRLDRVSNEKINP